MRQAIKIQILVFLLIVASLTNCQQSTITCHYSCKECVGQSYTLCSKCVEDKNITVVQDPANSQSEYVNSNLPSGVCTSQISTKANGLGIILLIIGTAIAIIVHTPSSIYLVSTLQSLALISFVEIAWLNPVNYLLQALQYFMLFNEMGSGYKNQDQTMRQRQYYRLDVYFRESNFLRNVAIIGIFNLLLVIAIVVLAIWKYRKDEQLNQTKLSQFHTEKSEKLEGQIELSEIHPVQIKQKTVCYKLIESILNGCLTAFYLLIQETSLVIMVSLRFERPLPNATKALPIIYCIILFAFMIYVYKYQLWFFPNKQSQFMNIWKKIGLPVFAIVPYRITHLIVIFMLVFVLLQSSFDFKGQKFKVLSRIALFKLLELIVVIFAGAYILTQLNNNLQAQTNIIRVFLAIAIVAFFICFGIQLFFGVIQAYCTKNEVQNESELGRKNKNLLNNTQQTINEINNVFQGNDKDKNVMIIDLQNQNIEDNDYNHNGLMILDNNNQANNLKKSNEGDKQNKIDLNTIKIQDMSEEITDQTDKAAKQQNQRQKKLRQQQEERLRKIQEAQIAQKQRLKKMQEAERVEKERLRKIEEAQIAQKQRLRKLEEAERAEKERLRKIEEAQKERLRKIEEAQKERLRKIEEEEQRARQKKIQQQEEAEQKARKKKKYIAQMDPELRKRYGF